MVGGDHCRAGGSALSSNLHTGNTITVMNSTFTGQGDCLIDTGCEEANCDGTEKISVRNTLFSGTTDWAQPWENTCLFYYDPMPADPSDFNYNLDWNLKNDPCPGANDICGQDPQLVKNDVDAFNGHLLSTSPARNAGTAAGAPADDLDGRARDAQPDIGAYEYEPLPSIGVFRPSSARFYLRNSNSSGPANIAFSFGSTTDKPLSGNWDGDADDTIGVYRPSNRTFFLRNTNSSGAADLSFIFGSNGDLPVAGDWDDDGDTTIGVYRPSNGTFYLRNSNSAGASDTSFSFGTSGDVPLVGDWDKDGDATIGVYRPSTRMFYLRNSNTAGQPDYSFSYGGSGDTPIGGDWNGDGSDSIGVFRPSNATFYLRNSNSGGPADTIFIFGSSSDLPLTGDWDGM